MLVVNPPHADLVRALGLDDPRAVLARTDGQPVGGHLGRNVVKLQNGAAGPTVYLKRECHALWKDRLRNWLRGSGLASKSWHEWTILRALGAHGIGCPEPLAVGYVPGPITRAFLAVAALPPSVNLADLLQAGPQPPRRRRRLTLALAREIARLHQAGFDHPDLYSKHVYIAEQPDGAWRVWFLDFQSTRRRARIAEAERWRDLAALDATLSVERVSRSDRLRFLAAYCREAKLAIPPRAAAPAIARHASRLLERRKIREMRNGALVPPARARCVGLDGRTVWAVPERLEALRRAGLEHFDDFMTTRQGRTLRQRADRANLAIDLPATGSTGPLRAYLKRHRTSDFWEWFWTRIVQRRFVSPGRAEAMNIWRIERAGVPAMRLIAYGERFANRWWSESFVLTEEVPRSTPLDAFLRARFPGAGASAGFRELRCLVRDVAELARRFHQAGYNHRDFYCCHWMVREDEPGCFAINLIDLQRVQYRRRFRGRWIVKDLAQLNYSAPPDVIRCTDRLRFLKAYLGVRRLGRAERRLIRRVAFKTRLIARRGIAP